MSVLPLKADIRQRGLHVRLVPEADLDPLALTDEDQAESSTLKQPAVEMALSASSYRRSNTPHSTKLNVINH
jgi:hypothetical protein